MKPLPQITPSIALFILTVITASSTSLVLLMTLKSRRCFF